jgi:hypothetical protein
MEPLTFFQMKVFNAQLAIRHKSSTQLNTQKTYRHCEKTRHSKKIFAPLLSSKEKAVSIIFLADRHFEILGKHHKNTQNDIFLVAEKW